MSPPAILRVQHIRRAIPGTNYRSLLRELRAADIAERKGSRMLQFPESPQEKFLHVSARVVAYVAKNDVRLRGRE